MAVTRQSRVSVQRRKYSQYYRSNSAWCHVGTEGSGAPPCKVTVMSNRYAVHLKSIQNNVGSKL